MAGEQQDEGTRLHAILADQVLGQCCRRSVEVGVRQARLVVVNSQGAGCLEHRLHEEAMQSGWSRSGMRRESHWGAQMEERMALRIQQP